MPPALLILPNYSGLPLGKFNVDMIKTRVEVLNQKGNLVAIRLLNGGLQLNWKSGPTCSSRFAICNLETMKQCPLVYEPNRRKQLRKAAELPCILGGWPFEIPESECVVCLDAEATWCCVKMHDVVCGGCRLQLKKCPYCPGTKFFPCGFFTNWRRDQKKTSETLPALFDQPDEPSFKFAIYKSATPPSSKSSGRMRITLKPLSPPMFDQPEASNELPPLRFSIHRGSSDKSKKKI